MKTYFLLLGFLICTLASAQKAGPQGAYQLLSAQYGDTPPEIANGGDAKAAKIIKDGYWIAGFYDTKDKPFSGACAGSYTIKDGKYVETLYFFSWDSTAAANTFSFDYTIESNYYHQYGKIQSDKYKDYIIDEMYLKKQSAEPVKNNALEGVWFLESGKWGDQTYDRKTNPDRMGMKIYAYPMAFFGHWDNKTHSFFGAGGSNYQFDGQTLTENLVFTSLEEAGKTHQIKITLQGDTYTQEWDGFKEVWRKAPASK